MNNSKTIVCLASSRRLSGRCIAGREITARGFGAWIRPVSSRPDREISKKDRCYQDGEEPKILDLISIQIVKPQPYGHQQENYLIDDRYYWEKKGLLSWGKLQAAVEDPVGVLWVNGFSSCHGMNDQVPEARLNSMSRSLYLLRPQKFHLVVETEGGIFAPAKRKVRAQFDVCGHSYCIVVTDPLIEAKFRSKPEGRYPLEDSILCVSLGEIFKGFAYKLAAGVILNQNALS